MRQAKNLIYLSGAEAVSKIVTFTAIAYLARVMGPVGFGYLEFAGSVLLCAGLLVDQGFGPYGSREIAKAPERTGEFFSEIVLARFLLALGAYAVVAILALSLDHPAVVTLLLLIYGLSLFGLPFLLQWVFQGHEQMGTVAAINLIRQVLYALVVLGTVRSVDQLPLVAVAEVTGVMGAALLGVWVYRRRFPLLSGSRLRLSERLFREGVPIGLSQAFWMMRMFGATVVLGLIASAADLGYFSAAMRLWVALHAFIYLYYFNLLPSMARTWQQGGGLLQELIVRSLRRVGWICLLAGMWWVLLAPAVIRVVYGSAFEQAGTTLQLLAGVGVAAAISGHYRFGLIAAGKQVLEMFAQGIGSIVALALIPLGYWRFGIAGAAAGLVVSEFVVWGLAWLWAKRELELRGHLRLYVPIILGASIACATCILAPLPLTLQLGALPVVLLVSAVVLDAEPRRGLRALVGALRGQGLARQQPTPLAVDRKLEI